MNDPKIFNSSSRLISQDLSFVWLIEWANYNFRLSNKEMNMIATKMIKFIVQRSIPEYDEQINSVKSFVNYGKANVMAHINDDLNLVTLNIPKESDEEKLTLCSSLLNLYREERTGRKLTTMYYASSSESKELLDSIRKTGWSIFTRADFLEFLNEYKEIIFKNLIENILND